MGEKYIKFGFARHRRSKGGREKGKSKSKKSAQTLKFNIISADAAYPPAGRGSAA